MLVQGEDGAWREPPGHNALWQWFGLSRASWLILPRVLMHAMPDDWQLRMAELLAEYEAAWDMPEAERYDTAVQLRQNGKIAPIPEWVSYRRPDEAVIESFRARPTPEAKET